MAESVPGPAAVRRPPTLAATLALLAATAAWGSTFVVVKNAIARMPVMEFLAWRFAIATVLLALVRPRAVAMANRQARNSITGIRAMAFLTTTNVDPQAAVAASSASVAASVGGRRTAAGPGTDSAIPQRAEQREVGPVLSPRAGGLQDQRHPPGGRMPKQFGKRGQSDRACAHPLVPIPARAGRVLRVVDVHQAEPTAADRAQQRVQRGADAAGLGQVVAGGVRVAGVQADPQPGVVVQGREVRREVGDPRRQRLTAAGGEPL